MLSSLHLASRFKNIAELSITPGNFSFLSNFLSTQNFLELQDLVLFLFSKLEKLKPF
jgi:hypothetical protein